MIYNHPNVQFSLLKQKIFKYKMKKLGAIILLSLTSFTGFSSVNNAVEDRPLHEIHSMMIYNFIKYIQWPNESQDFVIGVLGDDDVYNTLKSWYDGKVRGNKKFSIVKFNSGAEVNNCNILYISNRASNQFTAAKSQVGSSTLLITDKPGMGQKGSGINFKTVNGKLAFELNQSVIDQAHLKVSSQLTAMAIMI